MKIIQLGTVIYKLNIFGMRNFIYGVFGTSFKGFGKRIFMRDVVV